LPGEFPHRPPLLHRHAQVDKVADQEGILVGYRWYDTRKIEPLFRFGYGLSYATFTYRDLVVSNWDPGRGVSVRLSVKNTGARRGAEIVQVYVHAAAASVPRPEQELRAFAKVDLAPGEEREVALKLPVRAFATFHRTQPARHGWRVDAGLFEIRAGSSSRNIRLRAAMSVPLHDGR
jgi:hypothetical protein